MADRLERLDCELTLRCLPCRCDLTSDALALARFAAPEAGDSICDLGCGGGALLVLLAGQCPSARLCGVELQGAPAALARENLRQNGLERRAEVVQGDIRAFHRPGFTLVVANPPYFKMGAGRMSPDPLRRAARFELHGTLADFVAAGARNLAPEGRFCLVLPPARQEELLALLPEAGLWPRRVQEVRPRPDRTACLVLTEARKGIPGETQFAPPMIPE